MTDELSPRLRPQDVKAFRKRLGLSQAEFAQAIGLEGTDSARRIRSWELGEVEPPRYLFLVRLAATMCSDFADLLHRRGIYRPDPSAAEPETDPEA